jgi:tetratricopeptide (TPR) repeat protein
VDFADILDRISTGLTTFVRPSASHRAPTAPTLFRQADQCRQDGRYDEARRLLAEGLALQPNSGTGHLLAAYLQLVDRDMPAARASFHRVLDLDPYHPRALLGLARIALEEGDVDGSKSFLGRALQYYQDFPDAKALRDMLESWTPVKAAVPTPSTASPLERLELHVDARDMVLARADGSLVLARSQAEHQRVLTLHVAQVNRIASSALARSGLGALRRAAVDSDHTLTVIRAEAGNVLALTLPQSLDLDAAYAELDRVWRELGTAG